MNAAQIPTGVFPVMRKERDERLFYSWLIVLLAAALLRLIPDIFFGLLSPFSASGYGIWDAFLLRAAFVLGQGLVDVRHGVVLERSE